MRRNVILAVVLAIGLAGCGNFRDLFSAHANVAAEAAGQELPAERLAHIMNGGGKGVRLTRETADFIANAWVDYTLLGQAVAQGRLPSDSASIAEAVWAELSELKGSHWHDSLMARRSSIPEASVDSLYTKSDIRVLQHILFGVRPNTEAGQRAATRKKAEGTLAQIRKGASFSGLAAQLSEDPGSKADSGYLPPGPKGRFVPAFDSAGWSLDPGEVSGLVETAFGYHILKRPTLTEARPRLHQYLVSRAGARLDSLYMDSLAQSRKLEVVKDAPAAIRSALESPDEARRSDKALVRYKGGALTVKDLTRWTRALPGQYVTQLRQADDAMLNRFARLVAQNVLLLHQADSAGITVTPEEWSSLRSQYESQLDSLKTEMGLEGDVTDSSVALGEREKVAALKVERYFDQLVAGKARLRPLPSALATLLREHLSYSIHDAGVNRALELATAEKGKSDSTAAPGAMQRAPGPPPVPGGAPTAPPPAKPEQGQ